VLYPYRRRGIGFAGIGMFGPSGVSGKKDFLYIMLIGISRPELVHGYRVKVRVRIRVRERMVSKEDEGKRGMEGNEKGEGKERKR
jgi:hypothetical protein